MLGFSAGGRPAARNIPSLDGWRAIAILLVLAHHAEASYYSSLASYSKSNMLAFGTYGVDVFFSLSGFLITTLLLREASDTGFVSLRAFYLRRAFRIIPPCFALVAVVAICGQIRSGKELASCLLFFRNYVAIPGGRATEHLWSLAVEEHFYLIWPGLLVWAGLRRGQRVAAYLAIGIGLWRIADEQNQLLSPLLPDINPLYRTDLRLDVLLWGCCAAFLLHDPNTREKLRKVLRLEVWIGVVLACVACVVLHSRLTMLWFPMLVPVAMMGTVLHPGWTISRILQTRAARWIGRISYSLYLWQQLMLPPGWLGGAAKIQQWPLNLPAALAAAVLSYFLLERPLLAIGHRFAARAKRREEKVVAGSAIAVEIG